MMGMSKNIVVTLTKRFLLFLKQNRSVAHPYLPIISKYFYGNCQGKNDNRVVLFECIPSPPSEAHVVVFSLGITKYMAKKGLIKDRDKQRYIINSNCFFLSLPPSIPSLSISYSKR